MRSAVSQETSRSSASAALAGRSGSDCSRATGGDRTYASSHPTVRLTAQITATVLGGIGRFTILTPKLHPMCNSASRAGGLSLADEVGAALSVAVRRSANANPCGIIQRACGSGHAFAFYAD